MGKNNKKAAKRFLDNPEGKKFAKKFAEDLAEILLDTLKTTKDIKNSDEDIEKEIHEAIFSKEAEFREQIEVMSQMFHKENSKIIQKKNLTKVTTRSYRS